MVTHVMHLPPRDAAALEVAHAFELATRVGSGPQAWQIRDWAIRVVPLYSTETDARARRALARLLVELHDAFERCLARAPLDANSLPVLPGIAWARGSALAAITEDVWPFGSIDFWVGDADYPRRRRRARRRPLPRRRVPPPPPPPVPWYQRIRPPPETFHEAERSVPLPPLTGREQWQSDTMNWLARHAHGPGRIVRDLSEGAALRHFQPGVGRALVNHYCTANGAELELTRDQMAGLEAVIDLSWLRHPHWNAEFRREAEALADTTVQEMRASGQQIADSAVFGTRTRDIRFATQALTLSHGGLGEFHIDWRGRLSVTVYGDTDWRWSFAGEMRWSDGWNFEIREAGSDSRTGEGRRQTWMAHYLLVGMPFNVTTPWTAVEQTSAQPRAVWSGNDGTHEPRNIPLIGGVFP